MDPGVDHFLFDCDGTLFDTEGLKARSWSVALLSLLELEAITATYYRVGSTTREAADEVLRRCQIDLVPQMKRRCAGLRADALIPARAREKDRLFDAALAAEARAPAGQGPLLRAEVWRLAVEAGGRFPIGLVSASQADWVQRYFAASRPLDHAGREVVEPATFFHPIVCGLKKSLGIMRAVCEALAVADSDQVTHEQRRRFAIFEDSLEGLREARAVGVRTVAVPSEPTADPALGDEADLVIPQAELREISLDEVLRRLGPTSRTVGRSQA